MLVREIRAETATIRDRQKELIECVGRVEREVVNLHVDFAGMHLRLDNINRRLDRVERPLDLVDESTISRQKIRARKFKRSRRRDLDCLHRHAPSQSRRLRCRIIRPTPMQRADAPENPAAYLFIVAENLTA
jgi:hypothetical protein